MKGDACMHKLILLATAALIMPIAACTSDISSSHYSAGSVGTVTQTIAGTVVSVRAISVSSEDNNAGTLIGAGLGGVGGSAIGGGDRAHIIGAIGGAVLGGIAGNAAQKGLSSQQGYEYVIRLDNGNMVTVAQGNDVLLNPGQRCFVSLGNPARVMPAY